MKKEQKISERLKFDNRLVERYMRDGEVDRKEYEKYLKGLPDEVSKTRYVEVFEEEEDTEDESTKNEVLTFTSG